MGLGVGVGSIMAAAVFLVVIVTIKMVQNGTGRVS